MTGFGREETPKKEGKNRDFLTTLCHEVVHCTYSSFKCSSSQTVCTHQPTSKFNMSLVSPNRKARGPSIQRLPQPLPACLPDSEFKACLCRRSGSFFYKCASLPVNGGKNRLSWSHTGQLLEWRTFLQCWSSSN